MQEADARAIIYSRECIEGTQPPAEYAVVVLPHHHLCSEVQNRTAGVAILRVFATYALPLTSD